MNIKMFFNSNIMKNICLFLSAFFLTFGAGVVGGYLSIIFCHKLSIFDLQPIPIALFFSSLDCIFRKKITNHFVIILSLYALKNNTHLH